MVEQSNFGAMSQGSFSSHSMGNISLNHLFKKGTLSSALFSEDIGGLVGDIHFESPRPPGGGVCIIPPGGFHFL